jgi:hypothetical protein
MLFRERLFTLVTAVTLNPFGAELSELLTNGTAIVTGHCDLPFQWQLLTMDLLIP